MSEPEIPRAQALFEWWLGVAAAELIAPAKERIRLEIQAHFADSVQSHLATGCSEVEARLAALDELGDPYAAAKRFSRQHLTEKEAKRANEIVKHSRGRAWLLLAYAGSILVYFVFFRYLKNVHAPLVLPAAALFMGVGLQTLGFFAARYSRFKNDVRLLIFIQTISEGCQTICFFFVWWGLLGGWVMAFFVSIIEVLSSYRDLRLWRKLGQVDGVWPEIPSRA